MTRLTRAIRTLAVLGWFTAAGCSGGDDGSLGVDAPSIRTLAYVMNTFRGCREFDLCCLPGESCEPREPISLSQTLWIRRPSGETVKVISFTGIPVDCLVCSISGSMRFGNGSTLGGVFQRIGVTPDGSHVVFEVTDDFAVEWTNGFTAEPFFDTKEDEDPEHPKQEGIFIVDVNDVKHIDRLSAASRDSAFRLDDEGFFATLPTFRFRSDGRQVVFTDRGPSAAGKDAVQVVTLDLSTKERRVLTRMEPFYPLFPGHPEVSTPTFVNDEEVAFLKLSASDGIEVNVVAADGSGDVRKQPPFDLGGGMVGRGFSITGTATRIFTVSFASDECVAPADNPELFAQFGFEFCINERFEIAASDGENVLQLTNFRRSDTAIEGGFFAPFADRDRVYFTASADLASAEPPNQSCADCDNPAKMCQIFSVDLTGGDLRQLTSFKNDLGFLSPESLNGCLTALNCTAMLFGLDRESGTLLFQSSCSSSAESPLAWSQLFAMRLADGKTWQLTAAGGGLDNPSDLFVNTAYEVPGPYAYPDS